MNDIYARVAEEVRATDKDRYLAGLFAPSAARPHLYALTAFSGEIARVRDRVSDPLPGEVRLQWWHDLLEGTARGEAGAHPVAAALLDTVERFRLPRAALTRLIEARSFDLYDDPMPTLNDLEGYAGETASALIQLSAIVLAGGRDPGTAEAAGHAGVAYAITGLLRAVGFHAARGQVYVPADVLDRYGAQRADVLAGRSTPAILAALTEMRGHARKHLARTRALMPSVPVETGPAFLAVALVEPYLARMEKLGGDPFRTVVDLPGWQKQLILWRAARQARRRARVAGKAA
ncbi:phytoene/squalene synthase family protein [Prosthecomicrobium sp. N25]|uniref:phytoene/squalene synthase family protein n=1 Tax=Prosthecomicrobium sp. N25 TaxID=3129254 RepID=UPI003077BEF0